MTINVERDLYAGVAHGLLYELQIRALLDQLGREIVSQRVGCVFGALARA